jgi:signal transduction histidine kinase
MVSTARVRWEHIGVLACLLVGVVVPVAGWDRPHDLRAWASDALVLASGLLLLRWRSYPRAVGVLGLALFLSGAILSMGATYFPASATWIIAAHAALIGYAWRGRAAWVVTSLFVVMVVAFWFALPTYEVPLTLMTAGPYICGVLVRTRQETAEELQVRSRELEDERELFAALALRHERARIASELHDIVGHAISVMVVQAAAGQRLVDKSPELAKQAFAAIAESARQGKDDLQRLIELLGGTEVSAPDLSLVDEVVLRAARSGLDVSCRFEGDRDGVAAPAAHMAFRVVQESLTNALRHAPGAGVRVLVRGRGRGLCVRVENDVATGERPGLSGTGRGLTGLRERVQALGGQLLAGPTPTGGWLVEATVP